MAMLLHAMRQACHRVRCDSVSAPASWAAKHLSLCMRASQGASLHPQHRSVAPPVSCMPRHVMPRHAMRSALGGLLGGWLGDVAARWSSTHGRIIVCQLSVGFGVPFSFLVFKVCCMRCAHILTCKPADGISNSLLCIAWLQEEAPRASLGCCKACVRRSSGRGPVLSSVHQAAHSTCADL